jgi:hypothetical protein
MKMYWGVEDSYTILDLGTGWTHWSRGLGGPQSRSGRRGEEKNHALPGTESYSSSP